MPDIQELIALGIVALVAGTALWRRLRRKPGAAAGSCGDCAGSGPPPAESTMRFYRRNPDSAAGETSDRNS